MLKLPTVRKAAWGIVVIIAAVLLFRQQLPAIGGRSETPTASLDAAQLAARRHSFESSPIRVAQASTSDQRLVGTLTAPDGKAVEGMKVCAACALCNSTLAGSQPRCVQVDANGDYDFSGLPEGEYYLAAGGPGREPMLLNPDRPVKIGPEGRPSERLDGQVEEGGATLAGMVRDASGGPVTGATVQVNARSAEGPMMSLTTVSDSAGAFSLTVAKGPVLVVARLEGYAPARVTRYAPASDVRLVMTPPSVVRGHVVTRAEGRPVAGAQVWARQLPNVASTTTDASGAFAFDALKPGTYNLEATGPGWRGQAAEPVTVGLLETESDVLIPVDVGFEVSGSLRVEGGSCQVGEVFLQSSAGDGGGLLHELMSRDGSIRFEAVPRGLYRSTARCDELGMIQGPTIEVGTNDVQGVQWLFPTAGELLVRTLDVEQNPLSSMQVQLHPTGGTADPAIARDGHSDENGEVRFQRVPPGNYVVVATAMEQPTKLSVVAGQDPPLVVMTLQPTGYVDVRVTRPDGTPNDEVAVTLRSADGDAHPGLGTPQGDGHYRVGPIPTGRWLVQVRDGVNPLKEPETPVSVALNETATVQVVYGGHDGLIRGSVVDGNGEPLPNVWVSLAPSNHGSDGLGQMLQITTQAESRRVLSDGLGQFQIDEIDPAGSYTVTAENPRGGKAQLRGVKAGQPVVLRLSDPALLAGVVRSRDGSEVPHFRVTVVNESVGQELSKVFSDPTGGWEIKGVAPGEVDIVVMGPESQLARVARQVGPAETITDILLEL